MRDTCRIARLALIAAVLVVVLFPGQASAQFSVPFPSQQSEEYGPGISVTGVGFAPLGQRDRATARAIGDARNRADAMASEVGVSLGGIRVVEVNTPFEPRPACTRSTRGRCAPLDAVAVEVTFEIAGGPTSDEGAREVSGTGTGQAPVEAARRNSPAIRHALREARVVASPLAADAAASNAQSAARGSGVTLGPLFSIAEVTNPFGYGYEPLLGAFGPGQFCGLVRNVTLERDPETGRRHVVRHKRKRRCLRQSRVTVRVEATYLAG